MTTADAAAPRTGQRLISFYDQQALKARNAGVEQLPIARADQFLLLSAVVPNVVYVTHPSDDKKLIPFAEFDEELARDKLNEALRVFNMLGAAHVVAKAMRSDAREGRFLAGRGKIGVSATLHRNNAWDVAYDQRGSGGVARDPRPLAYPQEPGFQAACDAVLNNGARRMKIEITRRSEFGVDSELGARLKKAGFELGVGGQRMMYSMFVIEASFGNEELPNGGDTESIESGESGRRGARFWRM